MSYQRYKVPLMTFMSIICIACTEIVIEMMRIFNKPI